MLGLLRVTRAVLPLMVKNPGSSILSIGSVAGHTAYEGGRRLLRGQGGERKITQALRLELERDGHPRRLLDPGLAETEFSTVRFKGDAARARRSIRGSDR